MKLNQLSVIFIIIILPMTLVLSTYIGNLVDVSNQMAQYDALILNATYDAVKSFEMNDLNDKYNTQTLSLERNIAGSVNSFFDSLSSGMGQTGYTKEEVKSYVPVMLYTMYDGFYLYGPHESVTVSVQEESVSKNLKTGYRQVADSIGTYLAYCYYSEDEFTGQVTIEKWLDRSGHWQGNVDASEYNGSVMKYQFSQNKELEQEYGIKPYTYYTCRYQGGTDPNGDSGYNLTINYSLDNYIKIYGLWHGRSISESGYLVDPHSVTRDTTNNTVAALGTTITPEVLHEDVISKVTHNIDINTLDGNGRSADLHESISVVNVPQNTGTNGRAFDTVTNRYQYIIINNQKYYFDHVTNDYANKFNYRYDTNLERNMSFCDTYCGYPIFRLDESRNENKRVYLNHNEVQDIVDYLHRYPGYSGLTTANFYIGANAGSVDTYIDNSGLKFTYDRDGRNNTIGFNQGKLDDIRNFFIDINAWLYYNDALNFTNGGAYKDRNGDNQIDTSIIVGSPETRMDNNPDYWPGAATILGGIQYQNAVSNILTQDYRVISNYTGEVLATRDESDPDNVHYEHSHELEVNDPNARIFQFDADNNNPEMADSIFNKHRRDVIIKTIEYNLVNSIANFKKYVAGTGIVNNFDFQMPTLSEAEWDQIADDINVLSFVQGLPVKKYKYYSNYALVTCNKNNLFASKNSIYLSEENNIGNLINHTNDSYHDPRCEELYQRTESNGTTVEPTAQVGNLVGYANVDFDQDFMSGAYVNDQTQLFNNGETYYFYRQAAQTHYDCSILKGDAVISIEDVLRGGTVTMINGGGVTYNLSADNNARTAYIRGLARRKQAIFSARNPDYIKVQGSGQQ